VLIDRSYRLAIGPDLLNLSRARPDCPITSPSEYGC
jgi:hypothetical protein